MIESYLKNRLILKDYKEDLNSNRSLTEKIEVLQAMERQKIIMPNNWRLCKRNYSKVLRLTKN